MFGCKMESDTAMNYWPVQSTTLAAVSYSTDRSILEVKFRDGGVYCFFEVPVRLLEELLASDSKGAYFNRKIRNTFRFQWVS